VLKDQVVDSNGNLRCMYQEEWQIFADYENMEQQEMFVPTSVLQVCVVYYFIFYVFF